MTPSFCSWALGDVHYIPHPARVSILDDLYLVHHMPVYGMQLHQYYYITIGLHQQDFKGVLYLTMQYS